MIRLVFKLLLLLILTSCGLFSCKAVTGRDDSLSGKPTIIITFDDQHESIYDVAVPYMRNSGFRATNFINTGYIGKTGRLSWEQVAELEFDYGWETGGHSLQHFYLPELSEKQLIEEIEKDYHNLQLRGLSHDSFALPSGAASLRDYEIISRYYRNIRSSRNIRMHKPIDRKYIGYFAVRKHHDERDIIRRINEAVIQKESLVVIGFHRFNDPEHSHNCEEEVFGKILDYITRNSFEVITLKEATHLFINQ